MGAQTYTVTDLGPLSPTREDGEAARLVADGPIPATQLLKSLIDRPKSHRWSVGTAPVSEVVEGQPIAL